MIATTAATEQMPQLLDLVWEHLLPAFRSGPLTGAEEADAGLRERLSRLALAPAAGKPAPPERAARWTGAEFTPRGGACAGLPKLTAVAVTPAADGWSLTLTEDGEPLALRLGASGWTVAEEPLPVAVSGGWADADTLAVDLVFLETPHRLTVTCSLPERTFAARWHTTPLRSTPLRRMRAPRASG